MLRLIMSAVFAVFVLTGVPSIKELGLGCAVAIALDATLVRLILVPRRDEADGPLELVDALLARPRPAAPQLRGRRAEAGAATRADLISYAA